jgi:hypothetical protein
MVKSHKTLPIYKSKKLNPETALNITKLYRYYTKHRLNQLVEDLRILSLVEAGKLTLTKTPTDLLN